MTVTTADIFPAAAETTIQIFEWEAAGRKIGEFPATELGLAEAIDAVKANTTDEVCPFVQLVHASDPRPFAIDTDLFRGFADDATPAQAFSEFCVFAFN